MEAYGIPRHGRNHSATFRRNQECATGSASAFFHFQKRMIANFRWTALAEPVAHEKLTVKTSLFAPRTLRLVSRCSLREHYVMFAERTNLFS